MARTIPTTQTGNLTPRVGTAFDNAKAALPHSRDRQDWLDDAVQMAVFDGCGDAARAVVKHAFAR